MDEISGVYCVEGSPVLSNCFLCACSIYITELHLEALRTKRVMRHIRMQAPLRIMRVVINSSIKNHMDYVSFLTMDIIHWQETTPPLGQYGLSLQVVPLHIHYLPANMGRLPHVP